MELNKYSKTITQDVTQPAAQAMLYGIGLTEEDLKKGLSNDKLRFRFPPEPNGYLHIGHTKAIGISFGLGEKYQAPVNLRFDDTNPAKEEQKYVDAIKEDITWMGYQWDQEVYSSDYFQTLYNWAISFIKKGCTLQYRC